MQLPLQPVHDDLRKIFPVHFMGPVVADIPKRLVGVFDDRRTFIGAHRRDGLAHVGDHPGIGNHHLVGLFFSQIGKL